MSTGRVKSRERALLFRSLEVLFSSGVSLPRSLHVLSEQTKDPFLSKALAGIERRLIVGFSFSESVREFPHLFSDHCRRTLEVAEVSGSLPQVLRRIAEYEEKTYETEMMVRQALVYPLWILLASLIFVFWIPPFLFGELFVMLEDSAVELSLLTKLVLGMSRISGNPIFCLLALLFMGFFGRWILRSLDEPRTRFRLYSLLHQNSTLSRHLGAVATCRFARCLEMMSEVGVPVTQAMKLAGNASGDPVLSCGMPIAIEALMNGDTLEGALSRMKFFTRPFLQTVALGQESGTLPTILNKLVTLYEVELEYRIKSMLSTLEPLVMLAMGLVVGVFIIATMSPLMKLIQTL